MKTILVITNFSTASRNAAVYAAELAKISHSKLILHHIPGTLAENQQELISVIKENDVEIKLNAEAALLSQRGNVIFDIVMEKSNSIDEIILFEKEGDIDLVFIGVKAQAPLNDLIFKGEMRDLIRRTSVPVILIPEESSFKKIEKMAFAIDFKLEKELNMHPSIKELLNLFDPKILVLNVVKEDSDIGQNNRVSENNIEGYFGNRPHIYSFIENNDVIKGLNEFITINNIDMITMLPHKHNLLGKILVESKSRQMAYHTTIPLLLLPEG